MYSFPTQVHKKFTLQSDRFSGYCDKCVYVTFHWIIEHEEPLAHKAEVSFIKL